MAHKIERKRNYAELLSAARIAAARHKWQELSLGSFEALERSYELVIFSYGVQAGQSADVCIGAGIHGDEPAGPAAILKFLEEMPLWPELPKKGIALIACENPTGYELNTRENWNGFDLNRGWRAEPWQPEVAILRPYFAVRPFGLTLELHEDVDTHGFYLYERAMKASQDGIFGKRIIAALLANNLPVNFDSEIDGHSATQGVITPVMKPEDMPMWPKPLFNYMTHAHHTLTFESAPPLPLDTRVAMQRVAVKTALQIYKELTGE